MNDNHHFTEDELANMHQIIDDQGEVPGMPGVVYTTRVFLHYLVNQIAKADGHEIAAPDEGA